VLNVALIVADRS